MRQGCPLSYFLFIVTMRVMFKDIETHNRAQKDAKNSNEQRQLHWHEFQTLTMRKQHDSCYKECKRDNTTAPAYRGRVGILSHKLEQRQVRMHSPLLQPQDLVQNGKAIKQGDSTEYLWTLLRQNTVQRK